MAQLNEIEMSVDDNKDDEQENDSSFSILIKALDFSNREIRAANHLETIQSIKQKYCNLTGKAVETQILLFRGVRLKNNARLLDYKISANAILHVVFKRASQNSDNPLNASNTEQMHLLSHHNVHHRDFRVHREYVSFMTCFAAYAGICCLLPLISLPDIVTLIIVNDYSFNYSKDNVTRECVWTMDDDINISYFLNIGSAVAVLIYLSFALWMFWRMKMQNFMDAHNVQQEELRLNCCNRMMLNKRHMTNFWAILNFGMLIIAAFGIQLYEKDLIKTCKTAEMGLLLIVWSCVHFVLSFCICWPLCASCYFS